MPKKKIKINYLSRDFNTIKADLIDYAKRYYADTYKDFNEASFGSLMLDMTAYIGDMLSFYTDYQANESFVDTAVEYNNLIRLGRPMGFKFDGPATSHGQASFFLTIPANTVGLGPDPAYLPIIKRGTELATGNGTSFILNENVDFKNSFNEVVVAGVNPSNGVPTFYAVRATGQVISGQLNRQSIQIGSYEQFRRVKIAGESIAEIISVFDSEGHEYYEVEYLSQDVIYKGIPNRGTDRDMVREIMKPLSVPRRFIVERDRRELYLQFGYGSSETIKNSSIAEPAKSVLNLYGKDYINDTSFDPNKLLEGDKFGVGPSNTTLTVITRENTNRNVNAPVGSLTEPVNPIFEFENVNSLNTNLVSNVINSLEVENEEPITGDVSLPTTDELRVRVVDSFASQNRAVTETDYLSVIYKMPNKFGMIKRARIEQDRDSFKRNLNIYVLSEDQSGYLTSASPAVKENMKTWIGTKKMINDTIDILDAYIINLGIEFEAVASNEQEKYAVLERAIQALAEDYTIKQDIGQNFSITDIFSTLKNVPGLLDVVKVKIVNKVGGNYADTRYDIELNKSPDGRLITCPNNACFEIRTPLIDIVGSIK